MFARVAKEIGVDACIWFTMPLIFLCFYVRFPVTSAAAILPHLLILFLVFLSLSAIRILLALLLNGHWLSRGIATPFYAFVLTLELLYYPLVIAGLNAWGQVITWELFLSYARQAGELADALNVSLPFTVAVLCGCACFIFGTVWWHFGKMNWPKTITTSVRKRGKTRILTLTLLGAVSASVSMLALTFYFPKPDTSEPIVTTFSRRNGVNTFRGFTVDAKADEKLDRENDIARANYRPNLLANKKNLILIVVDALRPDHLGLYGYARDTTPHLSKLALSPEVSVRIVRSMRAICSLSACGLFGIASSRYFHEISARPFTIQQAMRAHGYEVRMILSGDHTNFYGLRDLYGDVDSYVDGSDPSAKYANSDRWVISKAMELPNFAGKPIMLQFHLMSAHPLSQREPAFTKFLPAKSYGVQYPGWSVNSELAINFYDNGVLQGDDVIHQLLQLLRKKRYLEDTLVVITADHGDALGEHGQFSHGRGVREAGILIPMVMLSFGYAPPPLSNTHIAPSQVDIAPTILSEFGMPRPVVWQGTPLQAARTTDITYVQEGDESGLIDLRYPPAIWKYWVKSGTWQEFAFNLSIDPGEHNNVLMQKHGMPSELHHDWRERIRQLRIVAEAR